MIVNNKWTRRAEQRMEYATDSEQNKHFLSVRISHNNGRFLAVWTQEIDEYKNGYKSTLSRPFDDCNGRITIKDARFNLKWLEKQTNYLRTIYKSILTSGTMDNIKN